MTLRGVEKAVRNKKCRAAEEEKDGKWHGHGSGHRNGHAGGTQGTGGAGIHTKHEKGAGKVLQKE